MHRGYRYRLYPTDAEAERLGQWLGATRLVYNLCLEQRRDFWRQYIASQGRPINWASQSTEVTALRLENDFIADVPRTCLEYAVKDLERAFKAFFNGAGFPKFRRHGIHDAIRFQGRDVRTRTLNAKWATVTIPKIGELRFRQSCWPKGEIISATIRRSPGAWFLVLAVDVEVAERVTLPASVGIDRGIANTISLSDGSHIQLPDLGLIEKRRRKAQRILARRKRGSARYAKQRSAVARLSAKAARVRQHHLHVTSSRIVAQFGLVALERLRVKGMTASAAGSINSPGRKVAQKRGLNRAILTQGWTIFATMLEYKLEAAGGRLVYVPAPYTSQTCAECGVVDAGSRKSQAVFSCVHCGHRAHADTNAALNILRGSTAFVEGGHLGRPCEARTLAA